MPQRKLSLVPKSRPRKELFSKRELVYIRLRFGLALSNKEIAERMNITVRTVKEYSSLTLQRLGLRSRKNTDYCGKAIRATKILLRKGLIQ